MVRSSENSAETLVVHTVNALTKFPSRLLENERALLRARTAYRRAREGAAPRVGVAGFNMSINAAGRAQSLADMYDTSFDTTLMGFLYERDGGQIWPPLAQTSHEFKGIHVSRPTGLPKAALDFVAANPFDIVHLSKARFPNVLLGALYKTVWGSTVFMDVDDEDLGIVLKRQETLELTEFLKKYKTRRKRWRRALGGDGARIGIPYWNLFDGVTVSNPALQAKYGGLILPHARKASQFTPSAARRLAARQQFGIAEDTFVFLFFGTARLHKGVLESAKMIADVCGKNALFVVAGSLENRLRKKLLAIENLNLKILPVQPYDRIPDVVGMADACVLSQSEDSKLAKHQLPAKLVDALGMGLMVFVAPTPAVQHIIDAGCVVSATQSEMPGAIAHFMANQDDYSATRQAGRQYFIDNLSVEACSPLLENYAETHRAHVDSTGLFGSDRAHSMFEAIGGWSEMGGEKFWRKFGRWLDERRKPFPYR